MKNLPSDDLEFFFGLGAIKLLATRCLGSRYSISCCLAGFFFRWDNPLLLPFASSSVVGPRTTPETTKSLIDFAAVAYVPNNNL